MARQAGEPRTVVSMSISSAVTPRTKAIILNSPNNPTGVVYSAAFVRDLEALISRLDHPVTVIADDTYRSLAFDGLTLPEIPSILRRTVVAYSWSKALAIPGERIGYLALSPLLPQGKLRGSALGSTLDFRIAS